MTTEGRYQTTDARALWFCVEDGAVVPIEAREIHDRAHGDEPRPTLAELQQRYLEVRQHTLSIDGKPWTEAVLAQARYVVGEAKELDDAVNDLFAPANVDVGQCIRHEIADVVLATVTLANLLGVTVEACIAEKTEHDRGRG